MADSTRKDVKGNPDDLEPVVPNAKDVSAYPGNEAGTVQPTTAVGMGNHERENSEHEDRNLAPSSNYRLL